MLYKKSSSIRGKKIILTQPTNYWLSSSDTENFMELDLECLLEIKSFKVRNTHNSAFNFITTNRLKVELTKWNDNAHNILYDADVDKC